VIGGRERDGARPTAAGTRQDVAVAPDEDVETIAAIATGVAAGGVGVIRLSGPASIAVAAALVGRPPDALPDRVLVRGVARAATGERIDEVLVVAMRAPRSYTGEEVAEIHGHGGALNMARLLREVLARGVRAARPGEFTRRAFERGKLDLTRVEAVVDVVEAGSERALRAAQAQLAGELGGEVAALRQRAVELLAEVEAGVDFPEEDLDVAPPSAVAAAADALAGDVRALAATFAVGRALRDGAVVAIVGPVNAGKSSLFNRLLGVERAIVADEPGTTRDFVEARVVWGGIPITLVDTAGEREGSVLDAGGPAERRGIDLGRRRAAEADLRVVVRAAERAVGETRRALPDGAAARAGRGKELRVVAKVDVAAAPTGPGLRTSAVTGEGIAELRAAIVEACVGAPTDGDDGPVVASARQAALLDAAGAALAAGARAARAGAPVEITALELRCAVERLAEVLGESVGDEVLDALFARFCVGK
jgi:tRNA modification GTPase